MRIYISGPITDRDYQEAFDEFKEADRALSLEGHEPVNPMENQPLEEGKSWKDYMLADIAILWDCKGIYMLPNWTNSKGARIEYLIAEELGLKIRYAEK